jgi:hypothetical protein
MYGLETKLYESKSKEWHHQSKMSSSCTVSLQDRVGE